MNESGKPLSSDFSPVCRRPKASYTCAANIALIKYWGKRDLELNLPINSSISATIDALTSRTTIEFLDEDGGPDELYINEKNVTDSTKTDRVKKHLGVAHWRLRMHSRNNFPTGSGLASSASGLAAFVGALCGLLEERPGEIALEDMSRLARIGSGSAARSFFGPFAYWQRGERSDGSDSYAHDLTFHNDLAELDCTALVLSDAVKSVPSTKGMQESVAESPHYAEWLEHINADLKAMCKNIVRGDFEAMGALMEENAYRMHGTTIPPNRYFSQETFATLAKLKSYRRKDGPFFAFTMDAGPNIKLFSLPDATGPLRKFLERENYRTIAGRVGRLHGPTGEHLF